MCKELKMTQKTLDTLKKLGFNEGKTKIEDSATLVKLILDYGKNAKEGEDYSIEYKENYSGAKYDPDSKTITIGKDYKNLPTLAHELAHAEYTKTHPLLDVTKVTAKEYAKNKQLNEGYALYTEYKILQELGLSKKDVAYFWRDGAMDFEKIDDITPIIAEIVNSFPKEQAIIKLAELNAEMLPSGHEKTEFDNLTYDEANKYYSLLKNTDFTSDYFDVYGTDIGNNLVHMKSLLNKSNNHFGENGADTIRNTHKNGTKYAQKEGLYDVLYGAGGKDKIYGNSGKDVLIGGKGDDTLKGGGGDDLLGGNGDSDHLYGEIGNDELQGGTGIDYLYGGENKDILIGAQKFNKVDKDTDYLYGGKGYDTYYADSYDIIEDKDSKGEVHLSVNNEDIKLTGGSHKIDDEDNIYKSDDGNIIYEWDKPENEEDSGTLYVSYKDSEEKLTINNWQNGQLGIELKEGRDIVFVIDTTMSMTDDIDAVRAKINQIIDKIYGESQDIDTRVAVVGYADPDTHTYLTFTNHTSASERKTAIQTAINSIKLTSGGSDYPEMTYSGILKALNGGAGEWRTDKEVSREIIVMGDADAKDKELASQVYALANNLEADIIPKMSLARSSYTSNLDYIANDTENSSPSVTISSIVIGGNLDAHQAFNDIATSTNGKMHHAYGANDLVDTIIKAVEPPKYKPYHIIGTDEDETLTENSRDYNLIDGMAGDDTITLNKEGNDANGGTGNDDIRVNGNNNTVNGNEGDDYIKVNGSNNTVYGNEGNDYISINQSDNIAFGNEGKRL